MLFASLTFSARDWLWPAAGALALGRAGGALDLSQRPGFAGSLALRRVESPGHGRPGAVPAGTALVRPARAARREPVRDRGRQQPGASDQRSRRDAEPRANTWRNCSTRSTADWQAALEENLRSAPVLFRRPAAVHARLSRTQIRRASRPRSASALRSLKERFDGRPLAGVLLFTDGNATDLGNAPADLQRPAAHLPGRDRPPLRGRRCRHQPQVNVTQSSFEDAPVTVQADVLPSGLRGEKHHRKAARCFGQTD